MKSQDRLNNFLGCVCFFGLPALAIGLMTFFGCQLAVTTGSSVVLGGTIGFVAGTIFLGAGIVASGTDMMDFAVSSIITIILTLILIPVSMRARQNSYKRAQQRALRKQNALRRTPSPNPTQKRAPQQH